MFYKGVLDIQYGLPYNMKSNDYILLGDDTRTFFKKKTKNSLRDKTIEEFFSNVKTFLKTGCKYIIDKLPLACELLKHAQVIDTAAQTSSKWSSLEYFIGRFPCLVDGKCWVS